MAYPFGKFSTLKEFIRVAVNQGCVDKSARGELQGPRGAIRPRYLTRHNPSAPVTILPNIAEDDVLTPIMLGQLVRTLSVTGYDHLLIDE